MMLELLELRIYVNVSENCVINLTRSTSRGINQLYLTKQLAFAVGGT